MKGIDHSTALQLLTLVAQLAIMGIIPWVVRVSNRLTKLETLITNGMSSDVRHIKDNCPGCQTEIKDVGRRVTRLEEA